MNEDQMIEAIIKAVAPSVPLMTLVGVAAGWLMRDLRSVRTELAHVAATARESHDALLDLAATLREKAATADREHITLHTADSAIDRRVRTLERMQMGLSVEPENGG